MSSAANLRNIGIIAHIDAGKTTFTERLLYYAGITHRMGEVHDGDSQMDYLPQERERGITITAAATHFSWLGAEVHLIDTPGHVDFTIEVERSLRVLDGAVAVFCGVGGVEPQSEVVWRQADRHGIPRLAFVNKLDRPGADFDRVVADMARKLGARGVPLTVPLREDGTFVAVADLVTMEKVSFSAEDQGAGVSRAPLSEAEGRSCARHREALLEAAADADDAAAEKYLAGERIPAPLLRAALRKGTLAGKIFPVFAGSALRNRGVQPAMDGIVHYLPSPEEAPPARGDDPRTGVPSIREPVPSAPFSALVFKVLQEEGRRTVYLRVYSGKTEEGDTLLNAATGQKEKVARLFRMHAGKKERIDVAAAGDIVAARGIRFARTGDTLCDPRAPIVYESIEIRKPVMSVVVEPRTVREMDRLRLFAAARSASSSASHRIAPRFLSRPTGALARSPRSRRCHPRGCCSRPAFRLFAGLRARRRRARHSRSPHRHSHRASSHSRTQSQRTYSSPSAGRRLLASHPPSSGTARFCPLRIFSRNRIAGRSAPCLLGCSGATLPSLHGHSSAVSLARTGKHPRRFGGKLASRVARRHAAITPGARTSLHCWPGHTPWVFAFSTAFHHIFSLKESTVRNSPGTVELPLPAFRSSYWTFPRPSGTRHKLLLSIFVAVSRFLKSAFSAKTSLAFSAKAESISSSI